MSDVGCGMWDVGCGMWDVGCGMWDVGCGMSYFRCLMWDVFSLIRVRTQVEDDYIRGELRSRLPVIQVALTVYVSDLEVLDLSGMYGSRVRCLEGDDRREEARRDKPAGAPGRDRWRGVSRGGTPTEPI